MEHLRNYLQACKARKDNPPRDASQIGNLLHEVFDKMATQCAERNNKTFCHTGFTQIDELIEGFEQGELIAVGGMPKSGKTAFALHCAIHVARDGDGSVWIYSLRHSAHQITKRMLSMLTGISLRAIEDARLTDLEWNSLSTACAWLREQDIRVHDLDMPITELCDNIQNAEVPKLLIVDDCFPNKLDTSIISRLKEFARGTNCCVILTSFYHDIHQYVAGGADKVLFLYGFEEQATTTVEINWNRYGRLGDAELYFDRNCLLFRELDPESN